MKRSLYDLWCWIFVVGFFFFFFSTCNFLFTADLQLFSTKKEMELASFLFTAFLVGE